MIELYADNYNLTPLIQQTTDVVENMRKEYGNNGGMSTTGVQFEDLIVTKYDPSFRLKPLPRDQYNIVMSIMAKASVTLRYTSVLMNGSLRGITAAPLELRAHYVMDSYGNRIYDGEIISFKQLSA